MTERRRHVAAFVGAAVSLAVCLPACGSQDHRAVSSVSSALSASAGTTTVAAPTGFSSPSSASADGGSCVPTAVRVPSVGIDEPVVAMGTNSQGQIYPPAHTTMWYDKSPEPGREGRTIIAGHVTYDGPDDFYHLADVTPGATVTIHCSNNTTQRWKVTKKRSELKTAVQHDADVWGGSDTPVVVLITCDAGSKVVGQHHLNNYLVWAAPA